jgi:hypothetical protein
MPTPSAEKASASAKLVGNVLWITRANLVACTDLLGSEGYAWQQHVTDQFSTASCARRDHLENNAF